MSKIWLITGTSRGFGREWTLAALGRGDSVAATARDTSTVDDLVAAYGDAVLPLSLDVTDREADFAAVAQAHEVSEIAWHAIEDIPAGDWHHHHEQLARAAREVYWQARAGL